MTELPESVDVARGVRMPFIPMRPQPGSPIRSAKQVKSVLEELDSDRWVVQPKLGGKRGVIAVVDKHLFLQNRHGLWIGASLRHFTDFLKLPNNTCLDGEILDDEFHPFECLAVKGQSLIFRTTGEREAVAFQLTKLIHHQWLFGRPTQKFLRAGRKNLPKWEGVVFKDYLSYYVMLARDTQTSPNWLKRKF